MPERNPADIIHDLRQSIQHLGDEAAALWAPGACELPTAGLDPKHVCLGNGHPNECDRAYELGDFGPLPDRPTAKQVRDSLIMLRADTSEAVQNLLLLIEGLQRQLRHVEAFAKGHRHQYGAWSGVPVKP